MIEDYPQLKGIKQGDTFQIWLDYSQGGEALLFPATQLRASVRDADGRLLTMLDIVADPEGYPGRFIGTATASSTQRWPEGYVLLDVKRLDDDAGVVQHTDTVAVPVWRAETK